MPIARIRDVDFPEARIRNVDIPIGRVKFGAILTPGTSTEVLAGTPMGLLLVWTYANAFTVSTAATFIGEQPTVRIRNTD